MSQYRLTVLGRTSLSTAEGEERLGVGKPLALVTYLALSPRRTATRDHLADLLWGNVEPHHARRTLRQALFQLRRDLGEDFLVGDSDHLSLGAEITSDRVEFVAAIETGNLARAVELYGGPFFPAFAAPGGAEFEHWADLERRRLRAAYIRALEAMGREALSQHRFRDAVSTARRLRDAAREREGSWRLLLEALISAGDWVQASAESDDLETMLRDQARTAEPATLAAIRAARQAPAQASQAGARLVAEMVGREAEFAVIVAAWDAALRGRLRHVHVTGTPGIGKTRLLRDAAARLSALGGHVVQLRANQGERDLPYALSGDLARSLASLPGATGIAPASAGVLLALDPALSSRFHSATPQSVEGDEGLRLRSMVLAELSAAVADERPVALFIDDLHWADKPSAQIVASLAARAAATRVLLVTSVRPQTDLAIGQPHETLTLRPLTPDQVGALMETIAAVPDSLRLAGLFGALHEATEGSPLLVLETLQLALDQGWLKHDRDEWTAPDPTALLSHLGAGSAIERRLSSLEPHQRRVLILLAVAGAPVPHSVLDSATRRLALGAGPSLQTLERRGFASPHGDAWETSHDLLTEKLLVAASRDELKAAYTALGQAWLTDGGGSPEDELTAARFLARAGETQPLEQLFRRRERRVRKEGDWRPARVLASEMLGSEHAGLVRPLVHSLPPLRRWRLSNPARLATLAAGFILLGFLAGGVVLEPRPHHLVIEQQPPVGNLFGQQPLVVRVVDRRGRPVSRTGDNVRLSVAKGAESWHLTGRTTVVPLNSRAVFDSVEFLPGSAVSPYVTLRANLPGLPSVETDTLLIGWGAGYLVLDSGRLNDQPLTPERRSVSVGRRGAVTGWLDMRYTAISGVAAVLAAAVPTWGDRRTNFWAVRALRANTVNYRERWQFRFTGPSVPGRYHIYLVAQMETEAHYLASATNWVVGRPLWGDGNDIRDWGSEQIARANAVGRVQWQWLYVPSPDDEAAGTMPVEQRRQLSRTRTVRTLSDVLATTIEVVVP